MTILYDSKKENCMAKEFNMNWGSKTQDSLGSQIDKQQSQSYETDILDARDIMVSEDEMNDVLDTLNVDEDR